MATQGIVSIVRDGKVQFKAVAGCDGMNAPALAKAIRERPPASIDEFYSLCDHFGFGCAGCLVVQNADADKFMGADGPLSSDYCDKFSDPRFNQRWDYGTADYVEVVEI